jgi:hypothetical protein
VEITTFVPEEKIEPICYDRAYYLAPDKVGAKPYALLMARSCTRCDRVKLLMESARISPEDALSDRRMCCRSTTRGRQQGCRMFECVARLRARQVLLRPVWKGFTCLP